MVGGVALDAVHGGGVGQVQVVPHVVGVHDGVLPAGLVVQPDAAGVGDAGDGPGHPVRHPQVGVVQPGHHVVAGADAEPVGAVGDGGVVDGAGGDELFPDDLVDRGGVVVGGHRHRLRHPVQVPVRGVPGEVAERVGLAVPDPARARWCAGRRTPSRGRCRRGSAWSGPRTRCRVGCRGCGTGAPRRARSGWAPSRRPCPAPRRGRPRGVAGGPRRTPPGRRPGRRCAAARGRFPGPACRPRRPPAHPPR